MIAYLSGAMEYEVDGGKSWRIEIEEWLKNILGHDSFNPVLQSEHLLEQFGIEDFRAIKATDVNHYRAIVRKFVQQDIAAVRRQCDYVICQWNEAAMRGGGTQGEVTTAFDSGKPVYLVTDIEYTEISGWILACATELFTSFDELKQYLLKKYL